MWTRLWASRAARTICPGDEALTTQPAAGVHAAGRRALIGSGAGLALPVAWGARQATGQFVALSVSQIAFAGLRLAAGLAIGLAGGGAGEVMLGVAAATAAGVLVSLVPLRPLLLAARGAARRR